MKLLWYMESSWWIHEKKEQQTGPSARFAKEMEWLCTHYHKLDVMFEDI
ncbi:hypothetical protein J2S11_002078 [Bacillus horti]|uniref:Uncharacterized protein n=1 Tax=Caldalkalibacillus horti TaxID=77523 RepID=A0ABT9VYV7_9BACI|nr:hypothetical protein [Bacillus horti]